MPETKDEVVSLMKIVVAAVETGAYDLAYEIIRKIKDKLDEALDEGVHNGHKLKRKS